MIENPSSESKGRTKESKEKVFSVPAQTNDLNGLMKKLTRASFAVKNVGCDLQRTYVYLAEKEEKDPTPIMERWVELRKGIISQAIAGLKKMIGKEKKTKPREKE